MWENSSQVEIQWIGDGVEGVTLWAVLEYNKSLLFSFAFLLKARQAKGSCWMQEG